MEYRQCGNEVEITGITDFDPVKIFECGQCFRWSAGADGAYIGVAMGKVLRVRREYGSVLFSGTADDFETIWRDYFDLDRDYAQLRIKLCIDAFMREATDFGAGIRLLRQDAWEALCSFIISQNNNIPRIKTTVGTLCREFGTEIEFEGHVYHGFPSAERLARLSESDLTPLRCGYRAEYIIGAAKAVADGTLDIKALLLASPDDALTALQKLRGVGPKVANCAVLFGLHKLDAFPVDVWMRRAVAEWYGQGFDPSVFSPYAGLAQQYMFYYTRNNTRRDLSPLDTSR